MDDLELAAAAAGGDQSAFEALIERHRARIYAVAYRVTLNVEDALDVTQNVFLHLSRRIGDFRGEGRFGAWVAAIAANQAVNHLRRARLREVPTEPRVLGELIESSMNGTNGANGNGHRHAIVERIELEQRRAMVEASLGELSPQQRAIFALRLGEGIGPKEIGERLGVPAKQVRSQFQRAVLKIRETIARETGGKP